MTNGGFSHHGADGPDQRDPTGPARIHRRAEVEPQESKEDFNQAKFREIIGFKDLKGWQRNDHIRKKIIIIL